MRKKRKKKGLLGKETYFEKVQNLLLLLRLTFVVLKRKQLY
jgi:hypothetical protein